MASRSSHDKVHLEAEDPIEPTLTAGETFPDLEREAASLKDLSAQETAEKLPSDKDPSPAASPAGSRPPLAEA
jgi:hypothetical protein